MDRKLYLELSQKVSVLKNGICGIKENVPDELKHNIKDDEFKFFKSIHYWENLLKKDLKEMKAKVSKANYEQRQYNNLDFLYANNITNNNEGDNEEKGTIFFKISIIFLVITNKLCLVCFDDVCWFN